MVKKKIATAIAAVFVFGTVSLLPDTVDSQNNTIINASADYYSDNYLYTVTGLGTASITEYVGGESNIKIPSTLDGYTVTSIGNGAFDNCYTLESVIIPDTVETLGEMAFYYCTNLKNITLSKKLGAISYQTFWHCSNLKSIVIPEGVNIIDSSAFEGCSALERVDLPDSITIINYMAFSYCNSLKSITIPKNVFIMGDQAFYECTSLNKVVIENGLEYLSYKMFDTCTNLSDITIPSSITYIDDYAFQGCKNLSSITIPKSVGYIGNHAFENCSTLNSIVIPDGIETIGEYTFANCGKLTSVSLPQSLKSIEEFAFTGSGIKSVSIPNNVTTIGRFAFDHCKNLATVTLPDNTTVIDYESFTACDSLNSITIPRKIKEIGTMAFGQLYDEDYYVYRKNDKFIVYCYTDTEGHKYAKRENLKYILLDEKIALSNCTITIPKSSYTYSGSAIKPTVTIKNGSAVLKNGTDYTVSYSNNINIGTATVTITGKGNYTGTVKKTFKITAINISACTASIPYASYTYRGRAIKPSVTVKDSSGKKLTSGTDYTISYSNNTNVGTATITVTGKGKYTGTLKKTFKVKVLDLSSSYAKISIPYSSYTYSGSAIKPKVTVKFKDGDVIPTTDYSITYSNNVKVGVATITIKGNGTNVTSTYKKTFVVKPAKNEITSISSTKGAFKISWKKGTAGTVGYQVQYSTDKNFVNNVHSYTSTNLSDLNENFSKYPNSGEIWYVKVRSFYTKDGNTSSTRYGNYSDVKSIKVK